MIDNLLVKIDNLVNRIIETRGLVSQEFSKEDEKQVRILIYFFLLLFSTYPVFILITFLIGLEGIAYVDLISFIFTAITFYFYRKAEHKDFVTNIVLGVSVIDLLNAYICAGAGNNSGIVWISMLPLFALTIKGIKSSLFITVLVSVIAISVNLFQHITGTRLMEVSQATLDTFLYINLSITPFVFFLIALILHYSREGIIQELKKKQKELEKSNESRKYLLSVLFHDLANSLVVAKNYSSPRVNIGRGEEKILQNIEKIHKSTKNIEEIISHVKEFQEQESAFSKIELRPVLLKDCLNKVAFIFDHRLREKQLSLDIEICDDETYVVADEISLCNSILNNLISNAIKFSPVGSNIKVKCRKKGAKVSIQVIDNGIGIPEDIREVLFEFDEFTSRNGTNGEKGTGYGLPIAKRYIDIFGGEINVNKVKDTSKGGTIFEVVLNLA